MQLEINNKKIGTKFNNYAIEQFVKMYTKLAETNSLVIEMYAAVYAGYLGWKFVKEMSPFIATEVPLITFEEVVDWCDAATADEEMMEQLKQVSEELKQSQLFRKMMNIVNGEEKKSLPAEPIPQ